MKVLVADDHGIMRKIVVRALASCGVTDVVEAADGQEAWEIFQDGSFDLVMTDWNMPNMSGLELILEIRGAESEVPIILVTTEGGETEKVLAAIQAGCTDYLCKPFEKDELKEKMEKYLPA